MKNMKKMLVGLLLAAALCTVTACGTLRKIIPGITVL